MKILVTGTAGFVGFHLVNKLARERDVELVGLDSIDDYYDVNLKYDRLEETGIDRNLACEDIPVQSMVFPNYTFCKLDIADYPSLYALFKVHSFDVVIHLAAQAGVRYSIENPHPYVQSNIVGFTNLLECCRYFKIRHFIYASSSSVYGLSGKIPFHEGDGTEYPVSFYAATKRSNELMAHTYSHLYQLPTTGVRLFTVYGPWGRPDMAPMLFAGSIGEGKTIRVFNEGEMQRDFTYVDDVVQGISQLIHKVPDVSLPHPFYRILNIGNSRPIKLMDFITTLETAIEKKAILEFCPMQPGDVKVTCADTSRLEALTGYKPTTDLETGVRLFVDWMRTYYRE